MNNALLSLLHLTDPTLPIGGFSHSAGLETYVQKGIVHDKKTAQEFIENMLCQNIHFNDAAFLSLAFEADFEEILALDVECTAVKLPKEMRQASQKLGLRLLKIFEPLTHDPLSKKYFEAIKKQEAVGHYCLVFALIARSLHISKNETLIGFYYNAAVGMVTNAVKLVPLSQQKGQEILFDLHPLIGKLAEKNRVVDRDCLGLCCTGFDLRSMQHERLYSRLYMS